MYKSDYQLEQILIYLYPTATPDEIRAGVGTVRKNINRFRKATADQQREILIRTPDHLRELYT